MKKFLGNQQKVMMGTALVMGVTMLGSHAQQTVTETANSTAPQQLEKKPIIEVTEVSPQDEDAWLSRKRLATARVPDNLKAQLQSGQPAGKLLRKFPYPYHSMLSITSDIDDTTPEEFSEYHRFLNTKEQTPNGPGLGLDVGDSFWMYMANNQPNRTDNFDHGLDGVLTYFQGTDSTQKHFDAEIKHYWKAGWLDTMHTFGDFSRKDHSDAVFKREYAVAAWDALKRDGINLEVWINHGNEANIDAFGAYDPHRFSAYQEGDKPNSPGYHTDLTVKNGVHFLWNSVGEAQMGWDSPLFEVKLRDGQKLWGFHRYTYDITKSGLDWNWVPREIHRQINQGTLDSLVEHEQYALLAQHLGGYDLGFPFDEKGVQALRLLAQYQDDGKVLVARTTRLLKYEVARKYAQVAIAEQDDETWLNVTAVQDPIFGPQPLSIDGVRGLTFYVKNPEKTHLLLDMKPISQEDYQFNKPDATGKLSIGFKWFKPDYTDYSFTSAKDASSL